MILVTVVGIASRPGLWRVLLERTEWGVTPGGDSVGYHAFSRIDGALVYSVAWYVETGFLRSELRRAGGLVSWNDDGTVCVRKTSGVRMDLDLDQAAPSAPWLAAGRTADQWWSRVRPDQVPLSVLRAPDTR